MRNSILFAVAILTGLAGTAIPVRSQPQERLSPPAKAECRLSNGTTVVIDYSSPRMRGRRIFGGLVPYGEVWRAGANEATTFVVSGDVTVSGRDVPAGSYTLFAIPRQQDWTLIISRRTGIWGIPYPGESDDFARVPMRVESLPEPVENFTIALDPRDGGCTLRMEWETTRAAVEVSARN